MPELVHEAVHPAASPAKARAADQDAERRPPVPQAPATTATDGESATELVAAMAGDVRRLAEQYATLTRIELSAKLDELRRTLARWAVGSALLLLGVLGLGGALGYGLAASTGAPRWVGLGVFGALALVLGALCLRPARSSGARITDTGESTAPEQQEP